MIIPCRNAQPRNAQARSAISWKLRVPLLSKPLGNRWMVVRYRPHRKTLAIHTQWRSVVSAGKRVDGLELRSSQLVGDLRLPKEQRRRVGLSPDLCKTRHLYLHTSLILSANHATT